MIKLLGQGRGWFKSPEQAQALLAVIRKEGLLITILPTGGGKSLLFMLPATLPQAGTTIVILPFVALIRDMQERCRVAQISCVEWRGDSSSQGSRPRIVLVS